MVVIRLAIAVALNFFLGGNMARTSDSDTRSVVGSIRGEGAMVMEAMLESCWCRGLGLFSPAVSTSGCDIRSLIFKRHTTQSTIVCGVVIWNLTLREYLLLFIV